MPVPRSQWISLGLAFGGHTPPIEVPSNPAPRAPFAGSASAGEDGEERAFMRAAGYMPFVPFPGRSMPWESTCATCGEYRQPTFEQVETGTRCDHAGPLP